VNGGKNTTNNYHEENTPIYMHEFNYQVRIETDCSEEELRRIARSIHEEIHGKLEHEIGGQAAPFSRDSGDETSAEDRSESAPETHDTFDEGESNWLDGFD